MDRKSHIDTIGAVALIAFALHLAFNQVVIKITTGGFNPVFAAGARSVGAALVLMLWMQLRGVPIMLPRLAWRAAFWTGVLFAVEFTCLFLALDMTTVSRASVIFYTMPVWLALAAHVVLPGERLTGLRIVGLCLAVAGVVVALWDRSGGTVSWTGDILALISSVCWAAIALMLRVSNLSKIAPAQQLLGQLVVSAPLLLVAALFFGPFVKDVMPIHLAGMAFQIVAVASLGFLVWFWLLTIYPASAVASFSFLSPIFAVILGWLLLSETVGLSIWIALVMVAAGIYLINRR